MDKYMGWKVFRAIGLLLILCMGQVQAAWQYKGNVASSPSQAMLTNLLAYTWQKDFDQGYWHITPQLQVKLDLKGSKAPGYDWRWQNFYWSGIGKAFDYTLGRQTLTWGQGSIYNLWDLAPNPEGTLADGKLTRDLALINGYPSWGSVSGYISANLGAEDWQKTQVWALQVFFPWQAMDVYLYGAQVVQQKAAGFELSQNMGDGLALLAFKGVHFNQAWLNQVLFQ